MNYCLFLLAHLSCPGVAPGDAGPWRPVAQSLRDVAGLTSLAFHRAATQVHDPAISHSAGPDLAFQLWFADLLSLERALLPQGAVQSALHTGSAAGKHAARWSHQAMAVRRYPVPAPWPSRGADAAGRHASTYFVSYEGHAADDEVWLAHYLRHHPPLMQKLPGLRALEVYSRVDCASGLDLETCRALQRNIVLFDDAQALHDALNSPVRRELRADFNEFPRFEGSSPHGAMISEIYSPAA